MKSIFLAITASILSQTILASELYCGANIERDPGTQIYNKLIFWEKMDTTKSMLKFLLVDGTLINSDDLTPALLNKVVDGSLAISVSFTENRPQLFLGRVKRNEKNEIHFLNMAISSSFKSESSLLIANDASLLCREM